MILFVNFAVDEEKKLKGKKAKEVRKKEKDSKLASREQRRKEQRERFTNREPIKIGENQVTAVILGSTVCQWKLFWLSCQVRVSKSLNISYL